MARPGGRGGGTAGHHPHRSADERAAATGVAAVLVAGRPFQHQPHLRRWLEQRSQPPEGARKALASQFAERPATHLGRGLQSGGADLLLHPHQHQPELRCDGAKGAARLGDRQAVEIGARRGGRFHFRRSHPRVPGAGGPQQADLLRARHRAGGGRAIQQQHQRRRKLHRARRAGHQRQSRGPGRIHR